MQPRDDGLVQGELERHGPRRAERRRLVGAGRAEVEVSLLGGAGALARLAPPKQLEIVPGATHLFEEPGALKAVVELAGNWFGRHCGAEEL